MHRQGTSLAPCTELISVFASGVQARNISGSLYGTYGPFHGTLSKCPRPLLVTVISHWNNSLVPFHGMLFQLPQTTPVTVIILGNNTGTSLLQFHYDTLALASKHAL